MIKVSIVGTGNISHHLAKVFSEASEVELIEVLESRSLSIESLSHTNSQKFEGPDLYILAVSDDAIAPVAAQFKGSSRLVVHTSGSVSLESLSFLERSGVFYPLQTFSKHREIDFERIPICLEASKQNDLELLRTLATSVSDTVHNISSEERKTLHLAAVFVNNFTNHLYAIGHQLCATRDLPFNLLRPLIRETAHKIEQLDPIEAQTGPARRNDLKTLERQLEQLPSEQLKEIYTLLTQSIQEIHGEKL